MKFILTAGWQEGETALAERLAQELGAGRKVLWLVSGGSNIQSGVRIMDKILEELSKNLSVMLIDERYGEVGHADSNWSQLLQAGFNGKQAALLPVLQEGLGFNEAIDRYQELAASAFGDNDLVIAQVGIGPDGHLAGILPGSPATQETDELVVGYQSDPHARLTLSFAALRKINVAYVFAFGEGKRPALQALQSQSLPLAEQPAQVLKELPEVYLYTDQAGGGQ